MAFKGNPASAGVAGTQCGMFVVVVWAVMTASSVSAAPPSSGPAATRPVVDARLLVRQLDDDDFRVRQAASMRLNSLSGDAVPVLEEALRRDDLSPETRTRIGVAMKILPRRAAMEERARRRDEFLAKCLHDAYRGGSHTGAAWDAAAGETIDAFMRLLPHVVDAGEPARKDVRAAARQAVDAGCDDPLVISLDGIAAGRRGDFGVPGFQQRFTDAHLRVQAGAYAPLVKLIDAIGFVATREMYGPGMGRDPAPLIAPALATPGLPPGAFERIARLYYEALTTERRNTWPQAIEGFLKTYAAARPDAADPLILPAVRIMHQTADSGDFDRAKLEQMAKLLRRAYEIDPMDPRPGTMMIYFCHYAMQGAAADAEMETWFGRAMAANPDNVDACSQKLSYLSPEAHGDADRMLGFGRECLSTQNWRGGIAQMLVVAHSRLADMSGERALYLQQPDVWHDCAAVYEGAVLNFPDDRKLRSEYAKLAADCGQWAVAERQFGILGDDPDLKVFVSKAPYDYLRRKAARLGSGLKGNGATTRPGDSDAASPGR